ncbi:MAG: glucose-6-phosphate isomerase [Candidatus Sumerlaeia bacterium]
MTVQLDYQNVLAERVGARHGVTKKELADAARKAKSLHENLQGRRQRGELGFFDVHHDKAVITAVEQFARDVRPHITTYVHLGIGGSSLGPIVLHRALGGPWLRKPGPRMLFCENTDPETLGQTLDQVDWGRTLFNVVSKSGGTAETLAAFAIFYKEAVKRLGEADARKCFVLTTDPHKGYLRELAGLGFPSFPIPPNVGGRFSVFSAVGLIPAAIEGLPIKRLLSGVEVMARRCGSDDLLNNPAYLNAALHYLADTRKGKKISVMMSYCDALVTVAEWYRQLWAESLGKAVDNKGRRVHCGQTPIKAQGAQDQHSQVQLYQEGPNDKIFTFLRVERFRRRFNIPPLPQAKEARIRLLRGVRLGDLFNIEQQATAFALTEAGRPNVTFRLDAVTPENVGGLLYLLQVQTAFAGELYDINAFDQPGVEHGKRAIYALLGEKTPEAEKLRQAIRQAEGR